MHDIMCVWVFPTNHMFGLRTRYARSIICRVDNARELEASIVCSERGAWPCVWEEREGMCWEQFSWTALAGRDEGQWLG
jgi:hypothetical protein